MSHVPVIRFDPSFLEREIDATARGLLREKRKRVASYIFNIRDQYLIFNGLLPK